MLNHKKGFSAVFLIIGLVLVLVLGTIYFLFNRNAQITNTPPKQISAGLLGNFDVSSDDQYIVFPYRKNGENNIYLSKIDGTEVKVINNTNDGVWPKFSPDNKRIVFLTYSKEGNEGISHINLVNLDRLEYRKIDIKDYYVSEAIFDLTGEKIYFLGAASIKKYSPIAKEAPHDFDIYSTDLNNSKITNITNKKYYSMKNLRRSASGKALNAVVFEGEDRLYIFHGENYSQLGWVNFKTTDRILGNVFFAEDGYTAVYTTKNSDTSSFSYDLYSTNTAEDKGETARKVTNLNKSVNSPVILKNNKVLFLLWANWPTEPPDFQLMEVGIDGNGLEKIDLSI